MKALFIRQFNYDHHSNKQIVAAIQAKPSEKTIQLMAHLLAAQQVWFSRCNNTGNSNYAIWPEGNMDTFDQQTNDNHRQWARLLETLTDADFEKEISYKNSRGEKFTNKLADILTHVINHGTHHRAQIGQLLKSAGAETLPITDYIFYIREQNKAMLLHNC